MTSIRTSARSTMVAVSAVLLSLPMAGGCRRSSVGINIPGTPITISAPVDSEGNIRVGGRDPGKTVYREVTINSEPSGAQIIADGETIGVTPSTVQVPFDKGFFGGAKGSTQIRLRKSGYETDTFRLFPSGNTASMSSSGQGSGTVTRSLRGGPRAASTPAATGGQSSGYSGYSSR